MRKIYTKLKVTKNGGKKSTSSMFKIEITERKVNLHDPPPDRVKMILLTLGIFGEELGDTWVKTFFLVNFISKNIFWVKIFFEKNCFEIFDSNIFFDLNIFLTQK